MLKDFKAFIMRGNVVDMAVGIIIGAAFGPIINSLVKDVIMPPIGLALGKVDFANLFVVLKDGKTPGPYASLAAAQTAGAVSINYGFFVNTGARDETAEMAGVSHFLEHMVFKGTPTRTADDVNRER